MTSTESIAATNEARVRRGYAAFQTGEMDVFHELFTPAVQWHVPGRNPLSGTKHGVDATIEYFGELFARTDGTLRAELIDVLANEERAVGIHRDTARRGARSLDASIVLVFKFEGERVCEAWEYYDDQSAVDAFFA